MADNKKYYYLRLKEDFFDSPEIKVLESQPNGFKYSNLLLKLYLMSIRNEGRLRLNELIPYDPNMIASITRMDIDTVKSALVKFQQMGLIERLDDGTIYMLEIQSLIGKSSTEADRKRTFRAEIEDKKRLLAGHLSDKAPTNVRQNSDKSTPEIEIEIEKELDKKSIEKTPGKPATESIYEQVRNSFITNCPSLPKPNASAKWTPARKKAVRDKKISADEFTAVFKKVEQSDFLAGRSGDWHGCSFDWILKPSNWQKINEGNYDNHTGPYKPEHTPTFDIDEYERTSIYDTKR